MQCLCDRSVSVRTEYAQSSSSHHTHSHHTKQTANVPCAIRYAPCAIRHLICLPHYNISALNLGRLGSYVLLRVYHNRLRHSTNNPFQLLPQTLHSSISQCPPTQSLRQDPCSDPTLVETHQTDRPSSINGNARRHSITAEDLRKKKKNLAIKPPNCYACGRGQKEIQTSFKVTSSNPVMMAGSRSFSSSSLINISKALPAAPARTAIPILLI